MPGRPRSGLQTSPNWAGKVHNVGVRRATRGPWGTPVRGGRGAAAEARGQAYRAVGAAQRHHQLRLVLVRLLRQLKGLLDRQQLLLRPHGAGTRPGRAWSALGCGGPTDRRSSVQSRLRLRSACSQAPKLELRCQVGISATQFKKTPSGQGKTARLSRERLGEKGRPGPPVLRLRRGPNQLFRLEMRRFWVPRLGRKRCCVGNGGTR